MKNITPSLPLEQLYSDMDLIPVEKQLEIKAWQNQSIKQSAIK